MQGASEAGRPDLSGIVPIDPREIKKSRHTKEKPLYALCVIITLLLLLVALIELEEFVVDLSDALNEDNLLENDGVASFASEVGAVFNEMMFEDESGDAEASSGEYEDEESFFALFLVIPFVVLFWLYLYYAETRAYAIRVTEKNFPEIYYKTLEFSQKLGLKKIPAVYIEQQHGILNAFAAAVLRRRYIMLNAELVDIAYMEHRDFDTVFYVLAHEVGHQYYNHTTFSFNFWTFIPHLIPMFGTMHSRAMEYSCDRIAQLLMGRDCVHEAMVLSAGRHLYKYVDAHDYLQTATREKGIMMWSINMLATHPITPKRISALADPQRKSGRLLWGCSYVPAPPQDYSVAGR